MTLEKVKTGLMAVLFVTCLLLSGQLLNADRNAEAQSSLALASSHPVKYDEIIYPQSCTISYGGGLYKGVYAAEVKKSLWQESEKYLKNYVEYLEINKMTQEDWDTAVKSKSVSFVMPFNMTLSQIQNLLVADFQGSGNEEIVVNTIVVPINEDERILIGDQERKVYYQLQGVKRDVYLSSLLSQYEKDPGVYDSKTVEELYGMSKVLSEVGKPFALNQVLFPITSIPNAPFVRAEDEMNVSTLGESELKQYVSKAFGSRNDFLKSIEDIDGSLVYLYGYSERALKIGADGMITYNKRYVKGITNDEYNFKEGLQVAISELENFGALPEGYYLSGYQRTKDKEGNFVTQYTFNYNMEQLPMYLSESSGGQPLSVEITGKQVTGIKRKISKYLRSFSVDEIWDEPMAMLDIFEHNYDQISKNFLKADYSISAVGGLSGENNNLFAMEMFQEIRGADMVYFSPKGKSDSLIPAWRLKIGSYTYIVNIYSGEILKEIPPEGVK